MTDPEITDEAIDSGPYDDPVSLPPMYSPPDPHQFDDYAPIPVGNSCNCINVCLAGGRCVMGTVLPTAPSAPPPPQFTPYNKEDEDS